MIAQNTLQVTRQAEQAPTLYLAPFGLDELKPHLPADPAASPFLEVHDHILYRSPADTILGYARNSAHTTTWGVYRAEPSPESFIGMAGLCEQLMGTAEDPVFSKSVQEMGGVIFPPNMRSLGAGNLAALALIDYAHEHDDTHAFVAEASANNVEAQKVLERTGFSLLQSSPRHIFNDGAETQSWMLADWAGQRALARQDNLSPAQLEELGKGWARHQTALNGVRVERMA